MAITSCLLPVAVLIASAGSLVAGDGEGRRIRLGGVSAGVSHISGGGGWYGPGWYGPGMYSPLMYGPGYGGAWGPAWWHPMWYGGWAHPGFWNGFAQGAGMGEVKLDQGPKDALVYLDGAFAGPVRKLKSMWLQPGVYELEVRNDGGELWSKKIYVLSGKTLQLKPELQVKAEVRK
ncbi:MAG TPA: hypothetical protein VES20_09630 [Bryobacteraceae bacterium]|nr:hypothetical protein [Bryobacteraceae bacterium]